MHEVLTYHSQIRFGAREYIDNEIYVTNLNNAWSILLMRSPLIYLQPPPQPPRRWQENLAGGQGKIQSMRQCYDGYIW